MKKPISSIIFDKIIDFITTGANLIGVLLLLSFLGILYEMRPPFLPTIIIFFYGIAIGSIFTESYLKRKK